jgi:hypothetical protein
LSQSVLRAALFTLCGGLLAAAGLLTVIWCSLGVSLRLAVPGLLLLLGLVFERWRYKRIADRPPGRDWVPTDERFIDPESGKPVTVFYQPATGERRYVESGETRRMATPLTRTTVDRCC